MKRAHFLNAFGAAILAIVSSLPQARADAPTPVHMSSEEMQWALLMRQELNKNDACGCGKPTDGAQFSAVGLDENGDNDPSKDGFEIHNHFVLFQECTKCRDAACIDNVKAVHAQLEADFAKAAGTRNLFNDVSPDVTEALATRQADINQCERTYSAFSDATGNDALLGFPHVTPGFDRDLPNLINTLCVYERGIGRINRPLLKWVPSSTNTEVYKNGCGPKGELPPALKDLEEAGFGSLAAKIGAKCCVRRPNFQASCVGGALGTLFRQLTPVTELYRLTLRRKLETSAAACDLRKYGRNSATPMWGPVRDMISGFDDRFRAASNFNTAAPTAAAKADYAPSEATLNAYAVLGAYGDPIKGKAGSANPGSGPPNPNPPPPDLPDDVGGGTGTSTAVGSSQASGCSPKDEACVRAYFRGKRNLFGAQTGCGCDLPTDAEFEAAARNMSTFSSSPVWKRLSGVCSGCSSAACQNNLGREFDALSQLPAQSFKSGNNPLRSLSAPIAADLRTRCALKTLPDPQPEDPAGLLGSMKSAFKCWQDGLSKLRVLASFSPSINGRIENVVEALKAEFPGLKAQLEAECQQEDAGQKTGCLTGSLANVQSQVKAARDGIMWNGLLPAADMAFLTAKTTCGESEAMTARRKEFVEQVKALYSGMRDMSGSGGKLAPSADQLAYWNGKSVVPIPRSADAVRPALDRAVSPLVFAAAGEGSHPGGNASSANVGGNGSPAGDTANGSADGAGNARGGGAGNNGGNGSGSTGSRLATLGASGSGDYYMNRCMDNTFLCNAGINDVNSVGCTNYCSQDLKAVGALQQGINDITAKEGLKTGSQYLIKLYLSRLRATAVKNTLKTFGQLVGNYDFQKYLSPEEKDDFTKGCLANPAIQEALTPYLGSPLKDDDAKVFKQTQTPEYKEGLARAAMDVMRNLYRFNYPWLSAPTYGNAPGHQVPDPDCPSLGNPTISFNGDAMVVNPAPNYEDRKTIAACCACGPDDNVRVGGVTVNRCGPAISTPSCKWVTTYNMGDFKDTSGNSKGEAAGRIRSELSTFPLLASGIKDWGEDAFDAKTVKSNLRSVYEAWDAAFRKDPSGKLDNLRYPDLASHAIDPSNMDGPLAAMRKRAAEDFTHSIAKFCRGDRVESKCAQGAKTGAKVGAAIPMVGTTATGAAVGCLLTPDEVGISDWDLVQLDGLKKQLLAETAAQGDPGGVSSLYRTAAECAQKSLEEHQADRIIGNIGIGACCLAAGIAAAPTVVGTAAVAGLCGTAFVGMAADEYKDAASKAKAIGICAGGASATVGACTPEDVLRADDEHKVAAFMLAVTAVGEAVGAGLVAKEVAALKGAAKWLTPRELDELARDLAKAQGREAGQKALQDAAAKATREQAEHQAGNAAVRNGIENGADAGLGGAAQSIEKRAAEIRAREPWARGVTDDRKVVEAFEHERAVRARFGGQQGQISAEQQDMLDAFRERTLKGGCP